MSLKRLMRDIKHFEETKSQDIFLDFDEANAQDIYALIIGPDDTPFEGGFFYFHLDMRPYPRDPPKVKFLTPPDAKFRIHPNLYACGKVCLSMLGTWGDNTWSPLLTIEKILVTIQALLDNNPIANEPSCYKLKSDNEKAKEYAIMSRYLTLKSIPWMLSRSIRPEVKKIMVNHVLQQFSGEKNIYEKSWTIMAAYNGIHFRTFHHNETVADCKFYICDILK